MFKPLPISLAAGVLCTSFAVSAQTAPAAPAPASAASAPKAQAQPQQLESVRIVGSLLKRTAKENPGAVDVIGGRDELRAQGMLTTEELLRSMSYVDAGANGSAFGSVSDAKATGFMGGTSTASLRGLGSQATLVLLNGRRVAPVAVVDSNFGRGAITNLNTMPSLAKVRVLKDGASAQYGSDAMAGVLNYELPKEYKGLEASAQVSSTDRGKAPSRSVGFTYGFGDLATDRYNVYFDTELYKRDRVKQTDLAYIGDIAAYDQRRLEINPNATPTYGPNSLSYGNFYQYGPTAMPGTTSLNRVNSNAVLFGSGFLGGASSCPAEYTVGKGLPNKLNGINGGNTLPAGMCIYPANTLSELVAEQTRAKVFSRLTYELSPTMSSFVEFGLARAQTPENDGFRSTGAGGFVYTSVRPETGRVTVVDPVTGAVKLVSSRPLVLSKDNVDNPTFGTAGARDVQYLGVFWDIPAAIKNTLQDTRLFAGVEGTLGVWDVDSAFGVSESYRKTVRENFLRTSKLAGVGAKDSLYRFDGRVNTAAAIDSFTSDMTLEGKSRLVMIDAHASRDLFKLPGGATAVALGAEMKRETMELIADEGLRTGDYVGLASTQNQNTSRNSWALFGEFKLPFHKTVEARVSARHEHSDDYGTSVTGKVELAWRPTPMLALFATTGTGFRAPGLSQNLKTGLSGYAGASSLRPVDPLRCTVTTSPINGAKTYTPAVPSDPRDCDVTNYAGVVGNSSLPFFATANPNGLKPETGRNATLSLVLDPTPNFNARIDALYFARYNEIQAQPPAAILTQPDKAAMEGQLIRDTNWQTWILKDPTKASDAAYLADPANRVANTGPIVAIKRYWQNYYWSKYSGVDYELNFKWPTTTYGQFRLTLKGTYNSRFDRKDPTNGLVYNYVGTTDYDLPVSRNNLTLSWRRGDWAASATLRHTDPLYAGWDCAGSTSRFLQEANAKGMCSVTSIRNLDLGASYFGIRNLVLSLAVRNATNSLRGGDVLTIADTQSPAQSQVIGVESIRTLSGRTNMYGRTVSLSAQYKFK